MMSVEYLVGVCFGLVLGGVLVVFGIVFHALYEFFDDERKKWE